MKTSTEMNNEVNTHQETQDESMALSLKLMGVMVLNCI